MFDGHVHSTASDGDLSPADVAFEAARRGLTGFSLTDHNGLWGVDEAAAAAHELGLTFLEGIEVTAKFETADVHVLGYSRGFDRPELEAGLATTRRGYEERIQAMVRRCQAAGYERVFWERIQQRRSRLREPCYVSFDVARELIKNYALAPEAARRLTVSGGACHVPYGDWALSPAAAVDLIHQAGGVASLAHPGTIEREGSRNLLLQVLRTLTAVELDGLEVVHPFHGSEYQAWLTGIAQQAGLTITGGSDWHGPSHLPANDAAFGKLGVSEWLG